MESSLSFNKRKKVIQVGGSVRSGTTLTGLILANQPNAMAIGEVGHLFYPYKKTHFNKIAKLKNDPIWNKILTDKPKNLYKNIFNLIPTVETIIDSQKDPFWFFSVGGNTSFYEIRRIVTYKTLPELKQSFKKRGKENYRKVYVNYYKRFFSVFPFARTVYLNDLLYNRNKLKVLCSFLDISFTEDILEYWNRDHPNFFGSSTVKKEMIAPPDDDTLDHNIEMSVSEKLIYDLLTYKSVFNDKYKNHKDEFKYIRYSKFFLRGIKRFEIIRRKIYRILNLTF